MKNFGNSSRGRSQGVPKIFRTPTCRAHCAVIFAIAQLSHEVPHWLYISKFHGFARFPGDSTALVSHPKVPRHRGTPLNTPLVLPIRSAIDILMVTRRQWCGLWTKGEERMEWEGRKEGAQWVHYIMSCCANYEPTRSAMQTSICQKRPIFRIPYYFAPQNAAPWKVPPPLSLSTTSFWTILQ